MTTGPWQARSSPLIIAQPCCFNACELHTEMRNIALNRPRMRMPLTGNEEDIAKKQTL